MIAGGHHTSKDKQRENARAYDTIGLMKGWA